MTIGENIRYIRKNAHMTQQQLADLTGVNVATIRGYESGKYKPKYNTVCKLSRALKCGVNEILEEPFVSDISMDNLEEIADGLRVPADYSPEVKEYLKNLIGDSFSDEKMFDNHLDRIMNKIRNNRGIDSNDLQFLCNDCINKYYQSLNTDGQKQADQRITNLLKDLQMLSKIPEYQKEKSSGNDTENGTK